MFMSLPHCLSLHIQQLCHNSSASSLDWINRSFDGDTPLTRSSSSSPHHGQPSPVRHLGGGGVKDQSEGVGWWRERVEEGWLVRVVISTIG